VEEALAHLAALYGLAVTPRGDILAHMERVGRRFAVPDVGVNLVWRWLHVDRVPVEIAVP
jgi:hypothetical protein